MGNLKIGAASPKQGTEACVVTPQVIIPILPHGLELILQAAQPEGGLMLVVFISSMHC